MVNIAKLTGLKIVVNGAKITVLSIVVNDVKVVGFLSCGQCGKNYGLISTH